MTIWFFVVTLLLADGRLQDTRYEIDGPNAAANCIERRNALYNALTAKNVNFRMSYCLPGTRL